MRWGGLPALIEREIYRFMTVITQTIVPPIISSFLFVFIFGFALGKAIQTMGGFSYLVFIVPGLMCLYLIESTYTNASSSLFLSRWSFYIQELLVTPLSYFDLVIALIIGSLVRGVATIAGVYLVASLFSHIPITHPWLFVYFLILIGVIFSSLGIITGLLSEAFEHLALMTNFIITPLTYFGGVFTSLEIAPPLLQAFSKVNPFFYMVNGFRYSMLGSSDVSIGMSIGVISGAAVLCFFSAVGLFQIGFKLRT